MVNPFRRWWRSPETRGGWSAAADWAAAEGHRFAKSRDGSGFVVEPHNAGAPWRLEWGPPKRHYFNDSELRVRADVGATGDLQMLVMSRELMSLLEQQVFEESTDGTETRMDDDLPEEMRWLVLYPKVPRAVLGEVREQFGALSNFPGAARAWLDQGLIDGLAASSRWLSNKEALALVMLRGRLTLRCALAQPEVAALQGALGLFDTALAGAQRVGEALVCGKLNNDGAQAA